MARLTETVSLAFVGRFSVPSMSEFMDHRAARLDLALAVEGVSGERIEVRLNGQPDLIDAFEMACCLGPADCMIMECSRLRLSRGQVRSRER